MRINGKIELKNTAAVTVLNDHNRDFAKDWKPMTYCSVF